MALTQLKTGAIADDAVTTDKLANAINTERTANTAKVSLTDNSVTLAKMAGGTDGQIITYDASGDPVAVGPGTDGQVLTSTGAGSPPAFETLPTSGATLTGSTDNTICTVTGANAIAGEANLTYNGTRLDVKTGDLQVIGAEDGDAQLRLTADEGDDGADYWRLESKSSDNNFNLATYASGAWVDKLSMNTSGHLMLGTSTKGNSTADDLTVATTSNTGITIRSGTSNEGNIFFADGTSGADEYRGTIQYNHGSNFLTIGTDGSERMRIDSAGRVGIGTTSPGSYDAAGDDFVVTTSGNTGLTINSGSATSTSTGTIYFAEGTGGDSDKTRGAIQYKHGDDYMRFMTDTGERVRILAGGGMTFNGDTAAANALDDYEEGTFSPIPTGASTTFSYAYNNGWYTKIGNTVTFQIYLMFYASSIVSGNGGNPVSITGLPFTIKNNDRYVPAFTVGRTYNFDLDSDKRVYSYGDNNTTNIRLMVESDDTTGASLTVQQVDQSTCLTFITGTYQI